MNLKPDSDSPPQTWAESFIASDVGQLFVPVIQEILSRAPLTHAFGSGKQWGEEQQEPQQKSQRQEPEDAKIARCYGEYHSRYLAMDKGTEAMFHWYQTSTRLNELIEDLSLIQLLSEKNESQQFIIDELMEIIASIEKDYMKTIPEDNRKRVRQIFENEYYSIKGYKSRSGMDHDDEEELRPLLIDYIEKYDKKFGASVDINKELKNDLHKDLKEELNKYLSNDPADNYDPVKKLQEQLEATKDEKKDSYNTKYKNMLRSCIRIFETYISGAQYLRRLIKKVHADQNSKCEGTDCIIGYSDGGFYIERDKERKVLYKEWIESVNEKMYTLSEAGLPVCPRVLCKKQRCLPVARKPTNSNDTKRRQVQFYCPRCNEFYYPHNEQYRKVPSDFFAMAKEDDIPYYVKVTQKILNKTPPEELTYETFVPKMFGFDMVDGSTKPVPDDETVDTQSTHRPRKLKRENSRNEIDVEYSD